MYHTNQKWNESNVDLQFAKGWLGVEWMVHKVANVECKTPVIGAVFEQIHYGHGGVRKSMNKDCLEQSLDIMQCPTCSSDPVECESGD